MPGKVDRLPLTVWIVGGDGGGVGGVMMEERMMMMKMISLLSVYKDLDRKMVNNNLLMFELLS